MQSREKEQEAGNSPTKTGGFHSELQQPDEGDALPKW